MLQDWFRGLFARLRALKHNESELETELRFHLEGLTAQFESRGLSHREAVRRARIELGGMSQIRENCRDQSGANRVSDFFRDTVFAIRKFRKEPGFAVVAILMLAMGIGLNLALFTLLYAVIFRPLPVKNAGTLRNVYMHLDFSSHEGRSAYGSRYFESFAEFQYMQLRAKTAELAGIAEAQLSLRGPNPTPLHAQLVSSNLLHMMGGVPTVGRFFLPEETAHPGGAAVVVLSDAAWRRYFNGDPGIVGRTITMNRIAFTVIGVANPDFRGPLVIVPDVWIPLTMQAITRPGESLVDNPNAGFVQIFAQPREGIDSRQMLAELSVLAQQAVAARGSSAQARIQIVRAAFLNYPDVMELVGPGLLVVALAGGMILLVACANIANLLLARGLSRRREIAIRLAIGAGRFRLLRQMVTESLLLGLIGGAGGLIAAWQGGAAALKLLPAPGPLQLDVRPDPRVLFFALALSIGAALACGLLPAFHALRVDLTPALKSEGLLDSRGGRNRLQSGLVGIQVAVSVILLVNAGMILRGFNRAEQLDTGKDMHGLLIASFDLRQQQYTPESAQRFHERLSEALSKLPDVTAVSASSIDPELSSNGSTVRETGTSQGPEVRVSFDEVGPDYFRTAGIPLHRGRTFTAAEVKSHARVGLIDEELAQRLFAGNGIGRWITLPGDAVSAEKFEVIGIVGRTRTVAPGRIALPAYYVPMQGLRFMEAKLWIRYRGAPAGVVRALKAAVQSNDREVTVEVHTIEQNVKTALTPVLIASWAGSIIAALALTVAAIGLYGLVSFTANRRLREMGVRMALGARSIDVTRAVFAQLPRSVGIGLAAGMVGAMGLATLIRAVLYDITPFDPAALLVVACLLMLVGVVASWVPVRRALRVDPASVLRSD
ncbi:MAG TPA: ABC transporter permease [Bryobacteraceae bacterium]|nr:ABC transporter permease [Bryobacteraceae bacterium]